MQSPEHACGLWSKGRCWLEFCFVLRSLMGTKFEDYLNPSLKNWWSCCIYHLFLEPIKSNEWTRKIRRTFNKEIPKWNSKTITSHCGCLCPVAQLCLTLCCPKDCSLPGFSAHGIFQGRILGVGCHFHFSCIGRRIIYQQCPTTDRQFAFLNWERSVLQSSSAFFFSDDVKNGSLPVRAFRESLLQL